jgi:hypothetical protein
LGVFTQQTPQIGYRRDIGVDGRSIRDIRQQKKVTKVTQENFVRHLVTSTDYIILA